MRPIGGSQGEPRDRLAERSLSVRFRNPSGRRALNGHEGRGLMGVTTMKHILLSMAGIAALAGGAPALAQYTGGRYTNQPGAYQNPNGVNGNGNLSVRIGQLQTRIQAGVQSGAISRSEAVPLRQQLRQLTQLERQYSRNGLTGQERSDLQQRIRSLRQQVRQADGGAQGRYDQYDRDDYGQNGQYDPRNDRDRIDSNNDGWDDRDRNRNGRWDDDAGNGYPEPVQPRSGLGGLLDSVLGGGGLRVGQRASANLGAVPAEYRNQYRDGNGVYYRSDGRAIYQIDAQTQAVVRVDPIR